MDAWEILQGNSTSPADSDAWTHLNNQACGYFFIGGVLTMSISPALSMESNNQDLTMDMKPSLTMDLETDELSVNIHNDTSMDSGI